MNACENITRLSRELGVSQGLLYTWRYRLEPTEAEVEGTVSKQNSRESRLRREGNKLKRLLADKTVEVDFFRNALQKVEARRQQTDISGEKASTTKFEMPLQGGLSIERMCQLAQMVNHKRVARIMRTDNLLTIQNRELRQVTDRDRELEIYLNLASRMKGDPNE